MLLSAETEKGLMIYQPFFMRITLFSATLVMACVMGGANNQPPATTTFARSRLPRSLLNAHCAVAGCWLRFALIV
jgi:hypothetical protein